MNPKFMSPKVKIAAIVVGALISSLIIVPLVHQC